VSTHSLRRILLTRGPIFVAALGVLVGLTAAAREAPVSVAPLLLLAALGSAAVGRRDRLRLAPGLPAVRTDAVVSAAIVAVGLAVFGPPVWDGRAGHDGDWPFHQALIETLYASLEAGRGTPAWVMTVSSGDPTFELYPSFVYQLIARLALALGSPEAIHPLTVGIALAAYVAVAVAVARVALRFAPAPAALLVGLATLLDLGAVFTWGARATWAWGLFPSSLAIALTLWTLPDLLEAIRVPPRRRNVVTIWIGTALATVAHPLGVVVGVALALCCGLFACIGRPSRRRRFLFAALYLAVGLSLFAVHWLPQARRLVAYGVHYGMPQIPLSLAFERALDGVLPHTSFPRLVQLGVAVPALALLLRDRSLAIVPFALAWALFGAYVDPAFLHLGGAPTPTTVRLQAARLGTVASPLLYAATAFVLGLPGRVGRRSRVYRMGSAVALLAVLVGFGAAIVEYGRGHLDDLEGQHTARIRDPEAFEQLLAFFRREASMLPPGRIARAMYLHRPTAMNAFLLIGTRTGVPVMARGDRVPAFFLREQPFAIDRDNLRRHAVRWVVGEDRVGLGAPSTERRFGPYVVRTLPFWDGELARVVEGEAEVRTLRADGEGIALSVTGERALVEIGTPYYPRWRAFHEGREIPVCARPTQDDPTAQRTLALWLPPGSAVLRPDGPLPTDLVGWPVTLLGLLGAFLLWPRRRPLPGLAAPVRWARRVEPWALAPTTVLLGLLLVAAPMLARQGAFGGVRRALRYGGVFGAAEVSLRWPDGHRTPCRQSDLWGHEHRCRGEVVVRMEMVMSIEDAPVGWASPAPGIHVQTPRPVDVEVRIPGRFAGRYLAACTRCEAHGTIGGTPAALPSSGTHPIDVSGQTPGATLRILAQPPEAWFSLADPVALDGDRTRDVPFCETPE
jgi:hypothetical protein